MEILKVANKGRYLDIWERLCVYIYKTSRFKHVLNEQHIGETNIVSTSPATERHTRS
jgi:hypothetical protein